MDVVTKSLTSTITHLENANVSDVWGLGKAVAWLFVEK